MLKYPRKEDCLKTYHMLISSLYSSVTEDGKRWKGGAKLSNVVGRSGRSALQRIADCVICHSVTWWDMGKGSKVRAPTIAVTIVPRLARTKSGKDGRNCRLRDAVESCDPNFDIA